MSDEPNELVRVFAAHLGWHGLFCHSFALNQENCGSVSPGTLVRTYWTTDKKFHLQINASPVGQETTYQATIIAERYGLLPIGWQTLALHNLENAKAEADRLKPYLSRSVLRNGSSRRRFVREHVHLLLSSRVRQRVIRRLARELGSNPRKD